MAAARQGLDDYGFGLASVRFICGTQDLHKKLEQTIADYFGKDDAILYASCFDANGGLFQPLLDDRDARSEEHTSELQSRGHLVCRLLLEKKNKSNTSATH